MSGKQFPELCIEFINASSWDQYRTQQVRHVGGIRRVIAAQHSTDITERKYNATNDIRWTTVSTGGGSYQKPPED